MGLLCLLSPAKRLEYGRALPSAYTDNFSCSTPRFASEASSLAQGMRSYDVASLRSLMSVSEKIAERSYAQYQSFDAARANGDDARGELPLQRAAMYAFYGDTYIGLDAYGLDEKSIAVAQNSVRILSGLYGLLRPLDAVQPYRLEMGLAVGKTVPIGQTGQTGQAVAARVFDDAATPADWWRAAVSRGLADDIRRAAVDLVVALASHEYLAAIDRDLLPVPLLEVAFLARKAGVERRLGMAEKRMRGVLARFIVANGITRATELQDFNSMGFSFSAQSSSEHSYRFVRQG